MAFHLMIIEDDSSLREELTLLLSGQSYRVSAPESFTDLAGQILHTAPDLVLLDLELPEEDGLTVCSRIRRFSDVPIIFVTGHSTSMDELNCLMRGGDDFIAKPYQPALLLAHISAVLKRCGKESSQRLTFFGYVFLLFFFLSVTGYSRDCTLLLLLLLLTIGTGFLLVSFFRKKLLFTRLFHQLEALDKPYLIGETMEDSFDLTDQLYRKILRASGRSVIEEIRRLEKEQIEYQEYIESWIHEVKAPLSSMNLLCERRIRSNPQEASEYRRLLADLEHLDTLTEQALFYARSGSVNQDYLIKEVRLLPLVTEAIGKNMRLLRESDLAIQICIPENSAVCCDGKWLVFILSQLLRNCAQYRSPDHANQILISAAEQETSVLLSVRDTGIGILPEDLPRIFEKGFTGANGRTGTRATGMGLYLCKQLCRKLGLSIFADSIPGDHTQITLEIPRERTLQIRKITERQSDTAPPSRLLY